jgi:hypothetical protein
MKSEPEIREAQTMRNKETCSLLAWSLMLSIALSLTACSNLEPELRKLSSNPSLTVVIKDKNDLYWAFSASRIKEIEANKIILKEGSVVAKGSGTAPSNEIADELLKLYAQATPGGFGPLGTTVNGSSGSISAGWEVIREQMTIQVAEIVSPKGQ